MSHTIKSLFPFFALHPDIAYLDNAATTQLPLEVIDVMTTAFANRANPGRGSHRLAVQAETWVEQARHTIANYIKAKPTEIIFTRGTTDGLHLISDAMRSSLRAGDEILSSYSEHHAQLLAWQKLESDGVVMSFAPLSGGQLTVQNVLEHISDKTKILAIQHVSNVTGIIHPIKDIIQTVKKNRPDMIVVVDGAQAVGHLEVNVKDLGCDVYAFSAHKMYGPDGIGALFIDEKLHARLEAVRLGGGAITSLNVYKEDGISRLQPEKKSGISHFESGTLPLSLIMGFEMAVKFLLNIGMDNVVLHDQKLRAYTLERLLKLPNVEIVQGSDHIEHIGLVSFRVRGQAVSDVQHRLDSQNIILRYGAHCASLLCDELGGETFRLSFGWYNDVTDVEKLIELLAKYGEPLLKNVPHSKNSLVTQTTNVDSIEKITAMITDAIARSGQTEVVIMAGHCLGIPDPTNNTFYPSINTNIPEYLKNTLKEFGMEHFPLLTWDMGCSLAKDLKKQNVHARLLPILNDTTGLNELRLSHTNKTKKTAENYRTELLERFSEVDGLPQIYWDTLFRYGLDATNLMCTPEGKCMGEHGLRERFHHRFIERNKDSLKGIIEYKVDEQGVFDLYLPIFGERQAKTCTFDTFHSKTGGKFCAIEVANYFAEIFGKVNASKFPRQPIRFRMPLINAKNQCLIMFTPAMCNQAVNQGAELYMGYLREMRLDENGLFFNIPIGSRSNSVHNLASDMTCLRQG